jgi:hypothetical protein
MQALVKVFENSVVQQTSGARSGKYWLQRFRTLCSSEGLKIKAELENRLLLFESPELQAPNSKLPAAESTEVQAPRSKLPAVDSGNVTLAYLSNNRAVQIIQQALSASGLWPKVNNSPVGSGNKNPFLLQCNKQCQNKLKRTGKN